MGELYSVFDNQIDAVVVLNKDKLPIYCNQSFLNLIDVGRRRFNMQKPIYEYITFDDPQLFCMPNTITESVIEGQFKEVHFTTHKNQTGPVLLSIAPYGEHWIIFLKDMAVEVSLHEKYKQQLAQLKQYSDNLEALVEERSNQILKMNQLMQATMNSLGEGILVFTQDGICLPSYSKMAQKIFENIPSDKHIADLFRLNSSDKEELQTWIHSLFNGKMTFDEMAPLGPTDLKWDQKHILISYFPLREADGKLQAVVVKAKDVTSDDILKKELEDSQQYAQMLMKIVTNKDLFTNFATDAKCAIRELLDLTQAKMDNEILLFIKRSLHTLKGTASIFGMQELVTVAHQCEDHLAKTKNNSQIQDQVFFINKLMELKELLAQTIDDFEEIFGHPISNKGPISEINLNDLYNLSKKLPASLKKELVANFIEWPVYKLLREHELLATDLARRQEKKLLPMIIKGKNTKVNPLLYSELFHALTHYFRNIIDHGIESPDERVSKGKPEDGQISIQIDKSDSLKLHITDDGRGIDIEKIKAKLIQLGESEQSINSMSEDDLITQIFRPGFSTASEVSMVSGRGIGMDVVKSTISKLCGDIYIRTQKDVGTTLSLSIPLETNPEQSIENQSAPIQLSTDKEFVVLMLVKDPTLVSKVNTYLSMDATAQSRKLTIKTNPVSSDYDYVVLEHGYYQTAEEETYIKTHCQKLCLLLPFETDRPLSEILHQYKVYHFIRSDKNEGPPLVKELLEFLAMKMRSKLCAMEFSFDLYRPSYEFELQSSKYIPELIESMLHHMELSECFNELSNIIRLVLNELLTNALYNAPVNESGHSKYHDMDRSIPLEVSPHEKVQVKIQDKNEEIIISIKDNFGTLSKEIIDQYIMRKSNVGEIDEKSGGAGLGLFLVMHNTTACIIHVAPNEQTRIVCHFKKTKKYKDFFNSTKAFHYFIWKNE